MRREDFVSEPDPTQLRMENDLLQHEITYLRSELRQAQERLDAEGPEIDPAVAEELAEARKDLRWLLRRLDAPPIGWLVRRRSGFQNLWSRWMDESDSS
jgi:hypothetical protein